MAGISSSGHRHKHMQIYMYNCVPCRRLCSYKRVCQACKNSICVAMASASCQPPVAEVANSPSYRYPYCLHELFYNAVDHQLAVLPPAMQQHLVCCVAAGFGRQQHFRLGRGDASVSLTLPTTPLAWWESATTYQPAARYETNIS